MKGDVISDHFLMLWFKSEFDREVRINSKNKSWFPGALCARCKATVRVSFSLFPQLDNVTNVQLKVKGVNYSCGRL